jgi:hypothetical protein
MDVATTAQLVACAKLAIKITMAQQRKHAFSRNQHTQISPVVQAGAIFLHAANLQNQHIRTYSAIYQKDQLRALVWMSGLAKLPEQVRIYQLRLRLEFLAKGSDTLVLDPNNFFSTTSEFKALGKFLATHKELRALRMESVGISMDNVLVMLQAFSESCSFKVSALKNIMFYNNMIGASKKCLEMLVRFLLMFPNLEQVSFIRNCLTDDDSSAICNLISSHQRIRRISVANNGICKTSEFIETLNRIETTQLFALDLSHNFIMEKELLLAEDLMYSLGNRIGNLNYNK